jgi:hypothetical protein
MSVIAMLRQLSPETAIQLSCNCLLQLTNQLKGDNIVRTSQAAAFAGNPFAA